MDGVRFGEMEIGAFLPIHITKYLASLQGLSKSLIRRDKGTLLQIFQAAKTNGMIPRDFAEDLRETVGQQRIKGTYDGHKALSRYWIDFIGQHYDEHRFGLFVMISMWTGLRPGEVCALTWDDIDLFRGTITVSKSLDLRHGSIIKDTKTAAGNRELPILPPLKKALLKAHKDSGTICCREDGSPHKQRSMEAAFDSFRSYIEQRANGVPIGTAGQGFRRDYWDRKHPDAGWKTFDYSQYDLRSTFCTLLYDSGVDIKTAQKLMGHKDAQTTMRIYTKLSEEHETESVQQMTDFISRTFSL
jgi:integrase